MIRNVTIWMLLSSISGFCISAQAQQGAVLPSNAEIRKILADRIDNQKRGVGIVVGVIEPAGRRVVAHGTFAKDDDRPVDGGTIFEIGSVTKIFTALLLADMVERSEAAFDDPLSKYLPEGVKAPERGGQSITLEHLANHTSGLPRLPANLKLDDMGDPYANYTSEDLFEFLSQYELKRDIGEKYEYSNLGAGLLGELLSRRAGISYEALVNQRISVPLGMDRTAITLSPEMREQLAPGHDDELKPVSNWTFQAIAGAGALRSNVNDMLTFVAANLEYTDSPLKPAMASLQAVRTPTGVPTMEIARGWHILVKDDKEVFWHNGGTAGYRSIIGFSPKTRVGVVVLSNTGISVDDIGQPLLDPSRPLSEPAKKRDAISVNPKLYEGYVGRYQLAPKFILTVTTKDDHLFVQATGQPPAEVFPESETKYFYKVVNAQITFDVDAEGRATALTLHQNGKDMPAKRMEGDASPEPKYKEVEVDVALFEGYVGRYQLAPNFILTVTADDGHLYTQATNQPRFEVFPMSEKEYFLKVVGARITFSTDGAGKATSVTLHQNGMDMPAKRIE